MVHVPVSGMMRLLTSREPLKYRGFDNHPCRVHSVPGFRVLGLEGFDAGAGPCLNMAKFEASQNLEAPFCGGPHNKGSSILGSIYWGPLVWKTTR